MIGPVIENLFKMSLLEYFEDPDTLVLQIQRGTNICPIKIKMLVGNGSENLQMKYEELGG